MTLLAWWVRGVPVVLLCVSLNGCVPSGQSEMEEEREPHFLEGKSCASSMDYKGAIEKFEQTLEVNPHHSKANLELGCLYQEKEPDPSAAIYHYKRYLKLRPDAENAEFIRQRITNCEQDLAKKVLLPITPGPGMQLQFDQLFEEKKRLQDEVDRWKAYATYLQSLTNSSGQMATSTRPPAGVVQTMTDPGPMTGNLNPNPGGGSPGGHTATLAARSYTIQAGDSLYGVARKFGVKLDALTTANPGLDPKRLRVGQTVNVPAP